jgi:hypothetical protein
VRCFALQEAVALARERRLTDLEQQGLIQAFEFTHELAWNTLKDFLLTTGASNLYGFGQCDTGRVRRRVNSGWRSLDEHDQGP